MGYRPGSSTACLLMFLAGCFSCLPAWGQQLQGSITRVVAGPSGSLIPDAQVTAAEQGTGSALPAGPCRTAPATFPCCPLVETMDKRQKAVLRPSRRHPSHSWPTNLKLNFRMSVGAQTTTAPSSAENRRASSSRELISFGFATFMGRQDSDF